MTISTVTIDFREPPKNGTTQVVFRMQAHDKDSITRAARLLVMTDAQFMRNACILAARQVISQVEGTVLSQPVDRRSVELDPETPPGMKA